MGLDVSQVRAWFVEENAGTYTLVKFDEEAAALLAEDLLVPLRRSYAADQFLIHHAGQHETTLEIILASLLPPPGATMAGDFGEILVYCYQGSLMAPLDLVGYKKWRLKQDRTKPAPYSDVIHVSLPAWPAASPEDTLLCSEVKVKSTAGSFQPIPIAIHDSEKDRTSRLAKTLIWLRERALTQPLGTVDVERLNRFIDGIDLGPVIKEFRAVAIVDAEFLVAELATVPVDPIPHCSLVVISIPGLKNLYSHTFATCAEKVEL